MAVMGLDRAGSAAGGLNSLEAGILGAPYAPAMAGNGSEILVAWTSGSSGDTNGYEIHAALVDGDGTSRSSVLTIPKASNAQARPRSPQAARTILPCGRRRPASTPHA
jgi:hypothetical protein